MNNGIITLNITGGDPAYQAQWSNGASGTSLSGLAAGSYTSTVTDANGCVVNSMMQITQPASALSLSISSNNPNCMTGTVGSVLTTLSGGTGPFSYSWSNGSINTSILNLSTGTYTVTVTDVNGCYLTKTTNITDQSSLVILTNGPAEICTGSLITLSVPATSGVQYQWSYNNIPLNGATSNSFTTPAAGTYSVTATSNCGNFNSNSIQVTTRTLQNVTVSNNFIICVGERAQLMASGGTKYSWSPVTGLNNPTIYNPISSPAHTTNYMVTIADDYGCKATANVQVAVMCDTLDVPNGFSPNNDGVNDYFVIDGLSKYPDNTLFIYNRWGNLIYKKQEYDNKWDGKSNVSGIYFSRTLPNGTYYYILDLKNDEKPLNGFVVIRK